MKSPASCFVRCYDSFSFVAFANRNRRVALAVAAVVLGFSVSGCGVPEEKHLATVNALTEAQAKLAESAKTIEELKAQLDVSRKEVDALRNAPENELRAIRTANTTPREKLKLLKVLADREAGTPISEAAKREIILTANSISSEVKKLNEQGKFAESMTLLKGIGEGNPDVAQFERTWTEHTNNLWLNARHAEKLALLKERIQAGQVPIEEVIGLVRGKSPQEVIAILGRPDSTSQEKLGQQFTYSKGVLNSYTGKGELLVIAFADTPINKVLTIKSASSAAYVDENVRKELNAYLFGR